MTETVCTYGVHVLCIEPECHCDCHDEEETR
jgi:hypothetical protein